jgi:hypothetical protein
MTGFGACRSCFLFVASLLVICPALAQSEAARRHVDRLAILTEEHKELSRSLAVALADKPLDSERVRVLQRSMDALQKEIAFVSSQPVHEVSGLDGAPRAVPARARVSNVSAGSSDSRSRSQPDASLTYEGWDIFRNFGKARRNDAENHD